jgi:hypothetical protein
MRKEKLAKILAVGMAVLACGLLFTACPDGNGETSPPLKKKFNVSIASSSASNLKWGDSRKLVVSVDTDLDGAPSYAWTGIAGTNPGNASQYEMVEADENKSIICTITIVDSTDGTKTKAASATVVPKYTNLSGNEKIMENRSTTKSDADCLAQIYNDTSNRAAIHLINTAVEQAKTDHASQFVSFPLKKIHIVNGSGSIVYANGILTIPVESIWNVGYGTYAIARDGLKTDVGTAVGNAISFKAKSQDVRLANAAYYHRMGRSG